MNSENLTYEFPELSPRERLRQLILYIAEQLKSDPNFGKTKLAKVLYFADFEAYRRYGKSITGSAYIHLENGPIPNSFYEVLPEMEEENTIAIEKERVFSYHRERVKALKNADLSEFSAEDMKVVDETIQMLLPQNAKGASDLSHVEIAWNRTEERELIPYEAGLLSDEPLSPEEINYGRKLAGEDGFEDLRN